MKNESYVHNVDELIASTSLDQVLMHYGQSPSDRDSGQHRINCVFDAGCGESSYGNLAIDVGHPAKQIYCHVCKTRGNLLTLVHGFEKQSPPATGKLRGQEFKDALAKLREIRGLTNEVRERAAKATCEALDPKSTLPKKEKNVPLTRHENEAARKIADLCDDLVTDPASMSPAAAQYVRSRSWMTPNVLEKWSVGYLPRDGRSMFRGLLVYTHRNQQGEVLSYSARDPLFEEKWAAWLRQGEAKSAKKKPLKHKYVKGYRRGLELYGQQRARLDEPAIRQSLNDYGLVVVEGANDVIKLDTLGIGAVGLCSNRATDAQIQKITRFAQQAANERVLLLPDNDDEGEAGFKELLWRLNDERLQVRLAWSCTMNEGAYDGKQPEQIDEATWRALTQSLT